MKMCCTEDNGVYMKQININTLRVWGLGHIMSVFPSTSAPYEAQAQSNFRHSDLSLGKPSQLTLGVTDFCQLSFYRSSPNFFGFSYPTSPPLFSPVWFHFNTAYSCLFFCILNMCSSHSQLLSLTTSLVLLFMSSGLQKILLKQPQATQSGVCV